MVGKTAKLICMVLLLQTACGSDNQTDSHDGAENSQIVKVSNPFILEPMRGRNVSVAYMELDSFRPDALIGAVSEDIKQIELHTIIRDEGHNKMRRVSKIPLKEGGRTYFSQGGNHLMLFGTEKLKAGETVDITLQFASGRKQKVAFICQSGPQNNGFRPHMSTMTPKQWPSPRPDRRS